MCGCVYVHACMYACMLVCVLLCANALENDVTSFKSKLFMQKCDCVIVIGTPPPPT